MRPPRTIRAGCAEPVVADGRQGRVSQQRWDMLSAVDSRRSQPLRGGLYGLAAFNAEQVYPCLVRTFERYGVPEAMLMDHGTVWWSTTNGYGLTWLSVRLIEQGIRLHYARVHHPQTQGKVERFHRTLDEAHSSCVPCPYGWGEVVGKRAQHAAPLH